MTKLEFDQDGIYHIPRKLIHPDPEQPRAIADTGLAASIEADGMHQAITVRPHPDLADQWMVVDGGRRYAGSESLKTIPCRIRLDLEDPADRVIMQLAANTGKPLTPIEQARAFRKIMDADPNLSAVSLAKRLGLPRSTIGDRLRVLELHPGWLALIDKGKLQVSHAPALHRYLAVPDKWQRETVERVADYLRAEDGELVSVDAFENVLSEMYRPVLKDLSQVPGYTGPVIEQKYWSGGPKHKFAADPDLWKPVEKELKRKAHESAKKARAKSPAPARHETHQRPSVEKLLAKSGIELPVRKVKGWAATPEAGETIVYSEHRGWHQGIDPKVLLDESMDSLEFAVIRTTQGSDAAIVTYNTHAFAAARAAFNAKVKSAAASPLKKLRQKLTDDVLKEYEIAGPGAALLLGMLSYAAEDDVQAIALAIGADSASVDEGDEGDVLTACGRDAERILAGLAATRDLKIQVPGLNGIASQIRTKLSNVEFRFGRASTTDREVPIAGDRAVSPPECLKCGVELQAGFDFCSLHQGSDRPGNARRESEELAPA